MASAATAAPHAPRTGIRNGWLRSLVVLMGTIAAVCVVLPVLPYLESERGIAGPTVTVAADPTRAATMLLIAVVACTAIGCIIGRLLNAAVGLFVAGCGIAMISMQTGNILDAAFDGSALRAIAIESLIWAGVVLAMSIAVFKVSGPLPDIPALNSKGSFVGEIVNADALRGALVGVAAVAVVWLLMRNDLKGQALGSGVAAGVAVAFAGRKFQGAAQPILLMAVPALAIAIAQLVSSFLAAAPLDQLVVAHALPNWSRMMPVDIAAGALIGVPVGLGWSRTTGDE